MLFQAQPAEIHYLMQRAIKRWPHLASRIEKAEQILLNNDIFTGANWFVYSQSNNGVHHTVCTDLDHRSCSCRDFETDAPSAEGRKFCKHLLAVSAYIEILRLHLIERINGSDTERNIARRLKHPRNQYLLRVGATNQITSEDGRTRFSTRWTQRGQTFATDTDAIIFSQWLAKAEPLPQPDIYHNPPDYARTANQSAWSDADWRRYLTTGEIPAIARLNALSA